MNKVNGLWFALELVFLVIFNVIFFMVGGTQHNTSVWISYGFIHFAYIMVLLTPLLTAKSKSSYVFGFAIGSISSSYFVVEFLVGLLFIYLKQLEWGTSFMVQLVIAGIYLIGLLSNMIANEHTVANETQSQIDLQYIKRAAQQLTFLMDNTDNIKFQKLIEKASDAIKSSPTKSHPTVASVENDIQTEIFYIDQAVHSNDEEQLIIHINQLQSKVAQRNQMLQMMN